MPVSSGRPGEVLRIDTMTVVLRVVEPGLFTTVQDLGRPNAISAGVPPGGAMDRFAHRAANLLVGNSEGDAGLECTLNGPTLIAVHSCLVAITGADFDPRVNGRPIPGWTGIFLGVGDRLTFGARRSGGRAYVAVAGGVAGDRWLGSLSTYMLAGRGGMHGRNLRAGDEISLAREFGGPVVSGRQLPERMHPRYADHTLFAVAGPHVKRLDSESRSLLFGGEFRVSREADRMGYRLDGHTLNTSGEELLSFGLAAGAVQVPRGGQPILLMGDHLLFAEVSLERAHQMRVSLASALAACRASSMTAS